MDGVFMKKIIRRISVIAMAVAILFLVALIRDRQTLNNELVRLHVVGASNSQQDQSIKLSVRDAVLASLGEALHDATNVQQAKQYIQAHLPQIEAVANETLRQLGFDQQAVVQFVEEEFPVREYETFSLPSGVYQSLRIVIGEGCGSNWWCVVFPTLCMGATSAEVEDVAADAGFSEALTGTITENEGYLIRFYLLDVLGRVENFFHRS